MDWLLLPGQCQYDGCRCTHCVNSNVSGRFCFTHGGRRVCSHASCLNLAQAGGRCIKHGYKKPTCSMDGCSNQSVVRGLCKRYGAHHSCNVINCTKHIFSQNMCQFHYSLANKTSTVTNESITVFTTTNLLAWETGNRYTLLLLCANFGDIHLYLVCTILGKFQWMVERNIDWTLVHFCAFCNLSISEMCGVFLSLAGKQRDCSWMT